MYKEIYPFVPHGSLLTLIICYPITSLGGASAGLVVGVLLAVLFVVLAVSLGGFFLYQKRNKDKAALADITLGSTSFANVLYESKSEAIGVEMVDKTNTPGTEA